jgi:hypothetical protein
MIDTQTTESNTGERASVGQGWSQGRQDTDTESLPSSIESAGEPNSPPLFDQVNTNAIQIFQ